ncbi:MAG TPA: isoprenylcysteine carboxylmethyltransferase family protein [Candidatus Binatia bacterium]|nr:isoprenylcysteine carboxylmethyltransferase family protein [Candidatus Binatia bacterium]
MNAAALPLLVGLLGAFAILAAGGMSVPVCTLATIAGGVFADLARRARREAPSTQNDATDWWSALAFFAILIAAAFDLGRSAAEAAPFDWALRIVGIAVIIAGVILRRSAVRALGTSFAVRLRTREDQRLVDSGPYRWIRHPNYTGLLLVALGTAIGLGSPLTLAATTGLWLPIVVVRIAREERMLGERFGEAYAGYQGRTWRLVPGLY